MLLEFELDQEDLQAFRRRVHSVGPSAAGELTYGIWFGLALGMLLAIPAAYFGRLAMGLACCGVPLLVAVAWWVGIPRLQQRGTTNAINSPGTALGKHALHFSQAGMRWVGPVAENHIPPFAILGVEEAEHHFFLDAGAYGFFIVPKRALLPHGGSSTFADVLQGLLGPELRVT